jgi:hypothetical protein
MRVLSLVHPSITPPHHHLARSRTQDEVLVRESGYTDDAGFGTVSGQLQGPAERPLAGFCRLSRVTHEY